MTTLDLILVGSSLLALLIFTVRSIRQRSRPITRHPFNRPVKRL